VSSTTITAPTFDRKAKEDRDYWVNKLSGLNPNSSNLKLDYERLANSARESGQVEVVIPDQLSAKLARLSDNSPFLVYTGLMAALKICLHKYTGSATVVVGSPARRKEAKAAETNALAVVNEVSGQSTVRQFLVNVRETLLEAYARQSYPFDRIVRNLGLKKQEHKCPLFDVALVLKNLHGDLPDVRNDITMVFEMTAQRLSGTVEYDRTLFRRETIERFTEYFTNTLQATLENVDTTIGELSILTEADRRQILIGWNNTATTYPDNRCIHALIEEQAEQTPDAVAVAFENRQLTYGDLNRRANQLAHYLVSLGVGPEETVGVFMERSLELIVALLGILKAGGAFVPLDPTYPHERLAFMLKDAGVRVLLSQRWLLQWLPENEARVVCLEADREAIMSESEANPAQRATAENLAYTIYTSGSTGTPKGSLITHNALVNYSCDMAKRLGLRSSDRILQFAPISFDVAIEEIFPTLLSGAAVVLREPMLLASSANLLRIIEEDQITGFELPTAYWQEWSANLAHTEAKLPAHLRFVIIGGETPSHERLTAWRQFGVTLYNAYGLTETTVTSTLYKLEATESVEPGETFPIGRPMANTQIYLLDHYLQPVPVGGVGELCIGGAGLGRGYLNRVELTAEKFIPDPFSSQAGSRLYKTGDLARYLPDGNIVFLGRVDHQVKLRGFRIELGEIEAVLKQHTAVEDAVVTVRDDGHPARTRKEIFEEEALTSRLESLEKGIAEELFVSIEELSDDEVGAILAMEMQAGNNQVETKLRRYTDFDISLTLKNDRFIKPPRKSQRNWLLRRALDEFADDLKALDQLSTRMVSGSARPRLAHEWSGSDASYEDSQLLIQGQQVMQDWERPLMKAMAEIVTESHGDILELGFGMGISATYIQEFGVKSYTVVEYNEGVVEHFKKWKSQYPGRDIRVIHGRWHDVVDQLGTYDGIFFDTVPSNEEEYMREVINNVVMAEDIFPIASKCLKKGGIFTWYTNEIDSFSRRHQRLALKYFSSFSISVVKPLQPPEDCHYWWSDSMVAVKAVK